MFFSNIIGVDLGTDTLKLRDKSGEQFMESRNMIARRGRKVLAIGNDAYAMYEKNPVSVQVVRPMTGGVIASAPDMESVLTYTLRKFTTFSQKSAGICIAVPSQVTPVEQRAFYNVCNTSLSPGRVHLVDKGIADAVSIGLPVLGPEGHMIVNIGADTTEISVISDGKVIIGRTLKEGGFTLDDDIVTMVRRKFNINIGHRSAEQLKNNLAFMINGPRLEQKVFGIHTLSGLPKSDMIPALAVSVAVLATIDRIVDEVRQVVDRTPPMLRQDIFREGIFLTGGVSMIQNLPMYLQKEVSLPVYHIQDPKNSTIRGLITMINQKELHTLMRSPKR